MDFGKRTDRTNARAARRAGAAGLLLLWLAPPLAAQTVTQSFAGLNYDTAKGADEVFRPPDTILGANGTHVIHATNSAIRLSTTSGTTLATTSLNTFFNSSVAAEMVLFDPRVVYDRLGPNQRFWVVALQRNQNAQPPTASIYLAVSRSPSPTSFSTASWCTYKINSVRDGGTTWADFPMVGVGADAFLISNDQFTFPPYDYRYAILRVLNKPIATNNAAACPALSSFLVLTQQLPGTDLPALDPNQRNGHVQPAVHYTAPSSFAGVSNPAYMFSAVAPTPTTSTYRVWRVRNVSAGSPTVDVLNITGSEYRDAPLAKQLGGGFLDINDSRIMQVAATGDRLWAVHTVGRDQTGSSIKKPVVRAMAVFVGSSGTTLTAFFQQIVELASGDEETDLGYYMPGIAVNAANQIAVPFLTSSPSRYLSAGWAFKNFIDPFFFVQAMLPANTFGTCTRPGSRDKVGDFVGAQTEPGLTRFWLAGERAVPDATGVCAWTTHIVEVTP
jgi:hypothetical protein